MWDDLSKERLKDICNRIANEKDHKEFSILIAELNRLLDPSRDERGKQNVSLSSPSNPRSTPGDGLGH
jgi:hypothetical protein